MNSLKSSIETLLTGYSGIFFLNSRLAGICLLLVTLVNPNIAGAGLLAALSAHLFGRFIGMDRSLLRLGYYTYNPLLVGFSVGSLFRLTPATILLVVAAGIFTLVVTVTLAHLFIVYLKLPVLSLPFALTSATIYLAASRYTNLYVGSLNSAPWNLLDLQLPEGIAGFFKALGAIFFLPHVAPGLALALILLFSSRIILVLAVAGYATGTAITALMVGSYQQALAGTSHFNSMLIAIAVGGIFLIPSVQSMVLAVIAVVVSSIILQAADVIAASYGIPVLTFPFNLVSLSFIFVLGLVHFPLTTKVSKATPEETLDWHLANRSRYQGSERSLALPFAGAWTVWQAFDGEWTHKGDWKHAYDFIITDRDGNSSRNGGGALTDYYAFGKPILSPVRGRVIKVLNDLPDNPIGKVDKQHPWGNLIIIQDERNFYLEISHLARQSIAVKEGDMVERGSLLGKCGNSGYSPQPHIHIQVQQNETPGSPTLPFSFAGYKTCGRFYSNNLPREGSIVEPMLPDQKLDLTTAYMLDDRYSFEVLQNGRKVDDLTLVVKAAPDGVFYFDSGRGRLYFGKHETTLYCYQLEGNDPYLRSIFLALPRMPLGYQDNLEWHDHLPLEVVVQGWRKKLIQSLSVFYHGVSQTQGVFIFGNKYCIDGRLTSAVLKRTQQTHVELDEGVGLKTIKTHAFEIRRKIYEPAR
jgi:urea transporter